MYKVLKVILYFCHENKSKQRNNNENLFANAFMRDAIT